MKRLLILIIFTISCSWLNGQNFDLDSERFGFGIDYSVNNYDYSLYNKLTASYCANGDTITTPTSEWNVTTTHTAVSGEKGVYDIEVKIKLLSGYEKSSAVAINMNIENWSAENFVLMPSAAYNGNRFDWRRISYSPKIIDTRDERPDVQTIISDVPRLNFKDGTSIIQARSGDMAVPSIGFHSPANNQGFLLLTHQANHLGDYGINIEENRGRDKALITLISPLVRERYKYEITDNMVASPDRPKDFSQGDSVTFSFRIYTFESPEIQTLYNKYFQARHNLTPTPKNTPSIPFSECYATIEKKFNVENFVPKWGYYSVGTTRSSFLQDWQIGWTGGMISTYPLLFSENEESRKNVVANFDWLFPNGISPSGYFWDNGEKGNIWYGGDVRKPNHKDLHLIRKSSDALYYIVKQFGLMEKSDIVVKETWKEGTQGVADAFVKTWRKWGQFGNYVDCNTGDVRIGNSTSAGIAPAALALASIYFDNKEYMEVAQQSAEYMYRNFVAKGYTTGGVGDAMQNPDSESAYGILESFAVLYETTGDKKWLTYGEDMAAQFSTWVMGYDYDFPSDCLLGKLKKETTGAVFANTQNKHGSPGICTHSGVALLRLYRATGNNAYLELLSEITTCIPRYMSHPEQPIPGMNDGWISERISTTDWFEGLGEIMYGSTWAETSMLLTTVEIPSIYIDTEKGTIAQFDQITTKILKQSPKQMQVEIYNPTKCDATVRIMAENATKKMMPLGDNYINNTEKHRLKAGEKKIILLKK